MTIEETIEDLRQHITRLTTVQNGITNALALIQKNIEALGKDLEVARNNFVVLQDIYIQKNSLPIGRN